VPLHIIPLQLDLFKRAPVVKPLQGWRQRADAERDKRTGTQWRLSILAYLEYRSGEAWRAAAGSDQRFNVERLWYLQAIAEIQGNMGAVSGTVNPPAPIAVSDDARSTSLKEPKAAIVSRLLAADPMLTDRRLLSGLGKRKLLDMLDAARARNAASLERAS